MNALKRPLGLLTVLLTATLWTSLCLALPAPHDIEQQANTSANRAPNAVSTAPHATVAPTPVAAPDRAPTAWFWPALLTGGLALLVLGWWRRAQSRPALPPAGMGSYVPEAPRGFGMQYDPRGAAPGYGNPYPSASPSTGSGVVGGLAGVAAVYALSKALEDHEHPAPHSDSALPRSGSPMDDMGVVRLDDSPGQDLGSFGAGAGDNWDAPTADDDNW